MERYLSWDYSGTPFVLFGAAHLMTAAVLVAIGWWVIRSGRNATVVGRMRLRTALGVVLLANELSWHFFNFAHGQWDPARTLPLHLCSVMIWVAIASLLSGSRRYDGLIYFLGIAGAVQAVITPDAGIYGFPHFRFFQTMIAHGGLIIAGIWVAAVEGYRPTLRAAGRILIALNVYALLVYGINRALGSNYLYVNGKPDIPSLLDFLPPWPWYIGILELLAIGMLLLLYFPLRTGKNLRIGTKRSRTP